MCTGLVKPPVTAEEHFYHSGFTVRKLKATSHLCSNLCITSVSLD